MVMLTHSFLQETAAETHQGAPSDLVPDLLRLAEACSQAERALQCQALQVLHRSCPGFTALQQEQQLQRHDNQAKTSTGNEQGFDNLNTGLSGAKLRGANLRMSDAEMHLGGTRLGLWDRHQASADSGRPWSQAEASSKADRQTAEHQSDHLQEHARKLHWEALSRRCLLHPRHLQHVPDAVGIRATKALLQVSFRFPALASLGTVDWG